MKYFRTIKISCVRWCEWVSVRVYMAWVCPWLQSRAVEFQKVFVARSTSHPSFSKPHSSRQKKLALSRPRTAALRNLHATRPPASPASPAAGHEHAALLTIDVTQRHHRCHVIFILLFRPLNTATHRWETKRKRCETNSDVCFLRDDSQLYQKKL